MNNLLAFSKPMAALIVLLVAPVSAQAKNFDHSLTIRSQHRAGVILIPRGDMAGIIVDKGSPKYRSRTWDYFFDEHVVEVLGYRVETLNRVSANLYQLETRHNPTIAYNVYVECGGHFSEGRLRQLAQVTISETAPSRDLDLKDICNVT